MMEFVDFVMADDQLVDSMSNGKELSPENAEKLRKFYKENKAFSDFMLTVFDDDKSPQCLKELNESQKRKLISITIDQMDFSTLTKNEGNIENKAAQDKLQAAIAADQDLGADVAKCFAENDDAFKILVPS